VMDDDDGFDLLRGYGVYVHLCTVQIGADRGRAEYMVRAATTILSLSLQTVYEVPYFAFEALVDGPPPMPSVLQMPLALENPFLEFPATFETFDPLVAGTH